MDTSTLNKISYGLFVLTASKNGIDNGCIINTAFQVTAVPNRICVIVNKSNYTHDILVNTSRFTISVISEEADFELFKHFGFVSGKDVDKFKDFPHCKTAQNGTKVILSGTNAYISGSVISSTDLGTHTMFIADVTEAENLSSAPSATYAYYHQNIKPKPSETAKSDNNKTVWRCKVCGYEYEGETLPDDYICPLCKHPASDFEKITSH